MQYSEEKADLAYQRHPDTNPNQRRDWKTRNKIPDRYFDDAAVVRKRVRKATGTESIKQDRLALVLASEKLWAIRFCELAELPWDPFMVSEFTRGLMTLNEQERLRLTTQVQKFRTEVRNVLGLPPGLVRRRKLVALASDVRLVKKQVFGTDLGRKLSPSRQPDAETLSADEWQAIENAFVLLLLETSL